MRRWLIVVELSLLWTYILSKIGFMITVISKFKSGFSSNEKGNTNGLLLIASIYNDLGKKEKTLSE